MNSPTELIIGEVERVPGCKPYIELKLQHIETNGWPNDYLNLERGWRVLPLKGSLVKCAI